jgi:Flp pilus assembly protein TadG
VGRILGRLKHAWREDLGQSMVEIALILPLFVGILLAGADLARAFAVQLAVQNGARAAAESYAIDKTPTAGEAAAAAVAEISRTPTVDGALATITVWETDELGAAFCPTHPPGGPRTPPLPGDACYVNVEVEYVFRTTIPWPLIPNTAHFDRSTTFRMFY